MHWKDDVPYFRELPEEEIPSELLEGLARLSSNATLLKVRFRWRPYDTPSTGFLTKDGLLELGSASNLEIAQALGSYARYLWASGACEPRFEAQVYRELTSETDEGLREWRSITFYVDGSNSNRTAIAMTHTDDTNDEHDFDDDSVDDAPVGRERPRYVPPPRPRTSAPHTRKSIDRALFGPYASYVDLARDDPDAFAVLVAMKVGEQSADRLERMLMASLDRFGHTLGHQASHHRFVNDALHTLTAGAGEVAEVGLRLFTTGLSQQADKMRLEHDSAIERERNELLRDAIEQGSMLAQAIIMSNAVKQRQAPESATPKATAASGFESRPTLSREEAEVAAADDRCLEVRTRQVLEALTPETLDELRPHAPTLIFVLDQLRSRPITAAWVREVVCEAQDYANPDELRELGLHLDPAIFAKFNDMIVRALTGGG